MIEEGQGGAETIEATGGGAGTPDRVPKSIILFSDGTGNSSAKLFKTNVWRMYEAVDLGPGQNKSDATQIAYYDNGVGTSSVRLLALIGGIFGWGLKRNILDIYRFLCRNYDAENPDLHRIYAFGFSRGAYTIRLVVALIGDQGVVPFKDERDLERQSLDAYRAFQSKNRPNVFPYAAILVRGVRDALIWTSRKLRGLPLYRPGKKNVPVRFVGVWDTVAAYGGPIAEITRGIDDWIWPLTMTDQKLGKHVQTARHALALDDERDSFHPVLWDEVYERKLAEAAAIGASETQTSELQERYQVAALKYGTRIQQVWFAGMHSDVGGGYPDESLSYVSLLWMMREAGAADLRLLPDAVKHVQNLSTPLGPIHDSRSGFAGYFRYQPRKIAAFMDPRAISDDRALDEPLNRKADKLLNATLSLRDPRVGEYKDRPQGLLMRCLVHESVVARIQSGTDGYAPIALPERFEVTPPPPPPPLNGAATRPDLVEPDILENLRNTAAGRETRQETAWDFVFKRRLAYFFIVAASLFILITPLFVSAERRFDGRSVWDVIVGWIGAVLPDLLDPWLRILSANPMWILVPAALIWLAKLQSGRWRAALDDRMRLIWKAALKGELADVPTGSPLRRFRNGKAYQRTIQFLKWRVAPVFFGWSVIVAVLVAALAIAAQARLARDERSPALCPGGPVQIAGPTPATVRMNTADPCNPTGLAVRKGERYRVTFRPIGTWLDGDVEASPAGIGSARFPWHRQALIWPSTLLRRVVRAGWMEPLYELRQFSLVDGRPEAIYIDRLAPKKIGELYVAEFEAHMDGELYLFVNDATLPWQPISYFYAGCEACRNSGEADVSIEALGASNR